MPLSICGPKAEATGLISIDIDVNIIMDAWRFTNDVNTFVPRHLFLWILCSILFLLWGMLQS